MSNKNLPSLFGAMLSEKVDSNNIDLNRVHTLMKSEKFKSLNYEILYKYDLKNIMKNTCQQGNYQYYMNRKHYMFFLYCHYF